MDEMLENVKAIRERVETAYSFGVLLLWVGGFALLCYVGYRFAA